jgi:hypothetical protein
MHSTLASIRREAEKWCALRGEIGDDIGEDVLGLHELGIATELVFPLYQSPNVSAKARGTPRAETQRRSESTRVFEGLASYLLNRHHVRGTTALL